MHRSSRDTARSLVDKPDDGYLPFYVERGLLDKLEAAMEQEGGDIARGWPIVRRYMVRELAKRGVQA